jgi:hypothetical protein
MVFAMVSAEISCVSTGLDGLVWFLTCMLCRSLLFLWISRLVQIIINAAITVNLIIKFQIRIAPLSSVHP